jgi:cytochrome c oxidase subunit 2
MVVLMRAVILLLLVFAAPQPPSKVVEVSAERFSFTPSEIKTTVGTRLEIRVTSDDTTHGFRIVGADINVEVPKRARGVATVSFTPAAPGRYTFECSHTCGAGHSFMRGVIVVTK